MRLAFKIVSSFALLTAATAASATVTDPAGDFLLTYTGPTGGDVDILSANVLFDGSAFNLSETANGTIGTTPNSLFVWGVNRGGGTARLALGSPSIGAGVLWDSVIVMFPDGTLRVVTFPPAGPPTITNIMGGTTVLGDALSGVVPLSLLPSTGFAAADYTFNLWSRVRVNPAADGTNAEIADFAPQLTAAAVPEPATWMTMLLGLLAIGGLLRGRQRPRSAVSV